MTSTSKTVPDSVLVSMREITKHFPGVLANDRIDLDLRGGEIHTILGENGAGKTTLMKILSGMCRPDRGRIWSRRRRGPNPIAA